MLSTFLSHKHWKVNKPRFMAQAGIAIYLIFIIYASLYPGHPWQADQQTLFELLFFSWINKTYGFDIFQNLLFYMPIGILWYSLTYPKRPKSIKLFMLTLLLSTTLEACQSFLPMRYPSILDIALNVTGALIGCHVFGRPIAYHIQFILNAIQTSRLKCLFSLGIFSGFLWAQWYPFLPTFHMSHYLNSLVYLFSPLTNPNAFNSLILIKYCLWGNITLIAACLLFKKQYAALLWLEFVGLVFLGKIMMLTRVVPLEAILGILFTLATYQLFFKNISLNHSSN